MQKAMESLLRLIENPFAKKVYSDLKKCYSDAGNVEIADAFGHLIKKRFGNESDGLHSDTQQSSNH
jgi:hypothetical protein